MFSSISRRQQNTRRRSSKELAEWVDEHTQGLRLRRSPTSLNYLTIDERTTYEYIWKLDEHTSVCQRILAVIPSCGSGRPRVVVPAAQVSTPCSTQVADQPRGVTCTFIRRAHEVQ